MIGPVDQRVVARYVGRLVLNLPQVAVRIVAKGIFVEGRDELVTTVLVHRRFSRLRPHWKWNLWMTH